MAALVSLPSLAGGAADGCGRTAVALRDLSASTDTGLTTISATTAECLITQEVLERLDAFLLSAAGLPDMNKHVQLCLCFDTIVRAIVDTLDDLDIELQRLRRYSGQHLHLKAKLVPILQDSIRDAQNRLRKHRSSLSLIMDCIESGILAEASIQLQPPSPGSSTEKVADMSQYGTKIRISLTKQSTMPRIQQISTKPRTSRSFWLESKPNKKLHEEIANGDYSAVCQALSQKADANSVLKGSDVTPIHRAVTQVGMALACEDGTALRDLLAIAIALVLAGADLSTVDKDGRNPLIRAVKGGMDSRLVALMLEYGACADATDRDHNTALHHAAMQHTSAEPRNAETIRTLVVFGADLNVRDQLGRTPLHKAVMWEQMEQVTQLLDYGSDLEVADNNGWTALYAAVLQGQADLTRLLCRRGAFVDKKDKTGKTALHHAVSHGRQEIVETLVDAGADVNLISKGETPLCRAAAKTNGPLVKYLLSRGADVSIPSPGYNGALPIHIAAIGKDLTVLAMLVSSGSSINGQDGAGRTPLAWAMEAGRNEMVHFLMSKGADTEAH